jgi:hypothetical protein
MRTNEIPRSKYYAIHYWIKYHYGKADRCQNKKCAGKSQNFQWALRKGFKYDFKRKNFTKLCASCHMKQDASEYQRERMRGKNSLNGRKTHCPKGHPLSGDNVWEHKNKSGGLCRECRECRRAHTREWRARLLSK